MRNHSYRGFTLIEVLVALFVLAIGIVGAGAAQLAAERTRQQAALMAEAGQLAIPICRSTTTRSPTARLSPPSHASARPHAIRWRWRPSTSTRRACSCTGAFPAGALPYAAMRRRGMPPAAAIGGHAAAARMQPWRSRLAGTATMTCRRSC
jgi:prepilin-type N-terminal cleavage/methylation domain-containing protein